MPEGPALDVLNPIREFITKSTRLGAPTLALYLHGKFVYERDQRRQTGRTFWVSLGDTAAFVSGRLKTFVGW